MEQIENECKDYLNQKVHPLLEKLVIDIIVDRPDNVIKYMKKWLDTKASCPFQIFNKLNFIEDYTNYSESSSDDEFINEEEQKKQPKAKQRSNAVSAEAFGAHNKKSDYKPKKIAKNPSQISRLTTRLSQAFMFQCLDSTERQIVIDAMEERTYNPTDFVIKQGDDGDVLFVVDCGELTCTKRFGKDTKETYLKTYVPGESFGELALLYNVPRAASIQAKNECTLFALDRECFNHIVKDSARKKREQYDEVLNKVDLLKDMDPYERGQIADALKTENFSKSEYVVRQGEQGDKFYMVQEGQLVAMKVMKPGQEAIEVFSYKAGDYFGELAILKNQPRQASIVCKSDVVLVSLDRFSFQRMLGPVEEILKRNIDRYKKYM